jgi:hypothetical protein
VTRFVQYYTVASSCKNGGQAIGSFWMKTLHTTAEFIEE